ncbi:MAG: N,N-dimethylformamidase beta subunit family domain-containing protein [Acidimicrobiales bacterium]
MTSQVAKSPAPRRTVRALLLGAALSLVAVPVVATASSTTTTTTTTSTAPTTTTTTPASLGPDGMVSPAIVAENNRTGTNAWRIARGTSPTVIQAFANLTYVAVGHSVRLYVSSQVPTYRVIAYRMGWYQGLGARQVWTSPVETGRLQPACPVTAATNMVSCANWSVSLVVPITSAWFPGDYLIKLVAGPRAASYVLLTVWDPSSTAAYVIMNRSFIEQGWNTYGGFSYYRGVGPCIIDTAKYPVCNRARVVSFDRPYDTGYGSSDYLTNEYPLIQLLEKEGLDVTYVTDVTVSEHPTLLLRHRALLSLDHDESWTYAERIAVRDAVARGVNVAYFGAAAMVRHVRLQPSPLGPDREEVDYRSAGEDPLNGVGDPMQVTANTWASPPSSWPPTAQIGVQYSGYLSPGLTVPMVIADAGSWVFQGARLHTGSTIPRVIGSDFDHVVGSSPPGLTVLAHSPVPTYEATVSGTTWAGVSYSDMVYFTNPQSQAGVFDTGDNIWIGDLRPCTPGELGCPRRVFTRVTNNVLRLFGQGPAGVREPSTSNLSSISPAGS